MMLKPGGPPKLGLQLDARVSKGVADVNARKERARGNMVENIITKMKVELSGECEVDVRRRISMRGYLFGIYTQRRGSVLRECYLQTLAKNACPNCWVPPRQTEPGGSTKPGYQRLRSIQRTKEERCLRAVLDFIYLAVGEALRRIKK